MESDRSQAKRASSVTITPQIRGVIGRARSSQYGISDQERAADYRTGLQYAILKSRTDDIASSPNSFFQALHDATALERAKFSRFSIGDAYLRGLAESNVVSFDRELYWAAVRLSFDAAKLIDHVRRRRQIDDCIAALSWDASLELIDQHDEAHGRSLWSTGLRLPIVQARDGKDEQKRIAKALRDIAPKTVLAFFATYVSQRAESTTSIGWFTDDMSRRLGRLPVGAIRTYLKYKLLDEFPEDRREAAAILRIEQNHNPIDQYETLIRVMQQVAVRPNNTAEHGVLTKCLDALGEVEDLRLLKLLEWLDRSEFTRGVLPEFNLGKFDRVIRGEYLTLNDLAVPLDAHDLFAAGGLYAARQIRRPYAVQASDSRQHQYNLLRGVAYGVLRERCASTSDRTSAVDYARKHGHVFAGTDTGEALRHLLSGLYDPDPVSAKRQLGLAALTIPSYGIIDAIASPSATAYERFRTWMPPGPVRQFVDRIQGMGSEAQECPDDVQWFSAIAEAAATNRTQVAQALWIDGQTGRADWARNQAAFLVMTLLAGEGEVTAAARLLATQVINHGVESSALPVQQIFNGVVWRDLKDAAASVELSNAMSLISAKIADDRIKTYRRFALETFLRANGLSTPSQLDGSSIDIADPQLRYFLGRVCTPPMLDMLPELERTVDVLQERRNICGALVALEPSDSVVWEQEVVAISRELTIQEGLQTFDGSRVHVDMDALFHVVKKEIAESYQRYESLDQDEARSSEHFELAIKEIIKRESQAKNMLALAVRESDELLISMAYRSLQQFLFNVPHGLDSYLSKRIRHGSIVGFIRSPAERDGLIAQRTDDGNYARHNTWADNVADLAQRAALTDSIITFSRSIDDHLIRLRDVLLHVRSEDKPAGMIDVKLTGKEYAVITSVAEMGLSLEIFTRFLLAHHRRQLRPSLIATGTMIGTELLHFVSEQFERLRESARRILTNNDEAAAFDYAAGAASTAMQSAVTSASLWFDPADLAPRRYTLSEVITIADASVRAVTRNFGPQLSMSGELQATVTEQTFTYLIDVLYVAFGNVAEHSGTGPSPKVSVEANVCPVTGCIAIRMRNDFAPKPSLADVQHKLSQLREEIGDHQAAKARQDKGSGLHKIASIISMDAKGYVEFNATENVFELYVKVPVFAYQELEEVA